MSVPFLSDVSERGTRPYADRRRLLIGEFTGQALTSAAEPGANRSRADTEHSGNAT